MYQYKIRVSLVQEINPTPHGTNWRQPCNTCISFIYI